MFTPEGVEMDASRHHDHGYTSEPITIGSPDVATGFLHAVPLSVAQRIVTCSFVLQTDANAANRLPRLDYLNGSGDAFFFIGAPFSTPANTFARYNFGIGVQTFGANGAGVIGGSLPDLRLYGGLGFQVFVANMQAGDQMDGISLFVDQWPVRD